MTVKVFQLKCALGKLGAFFEANNAIGIAPGEGDVVYEAWGSGAGETRYGDKLSRTLEEKLGASTIRAAYEAAASLTLEIASE